jgi:hypothetical protein
MTLRRIAVLFAIAVTLPSADAMAQSLGTFRWQLLPFGRVLNLTVTQQGSIYLLNGFEAQCSNPSLPVWGVAVPQANGSVLMGLTTITEQGNGLHTRISLSPTDFSGSWIDNANSNGTLRFNPPNPCPSGPRIGPVEPDPTAAAWPTASAGVSADMMKTLLSELESLRQRLSALEAKKQ